MEVKNTLEGVLPEQYFEEYREIWWNDLVYVHSSKHRNLHTIEYEANWTTNKDWMKNSLVNADVYQHWLAPFKLGANARQHRWMVATALDDAGEQAGLI